VRKIAAHAKDDQRVEWRRAAPGAWHLSHLLVDFYAWFPPPLRTIFEDRETNQMPRRSSCITPSRIWYAMPWEEAGAARISGFSCFTSCAQ
jgi:hypothetical protein